MRLITTLPLIIACLVVSALCPAMKPQSVPYPDRGFVSLQPATFWEQALISGNGRVGALVFGQPVDETIIVNHARLFLPLNKPLMPPNTASRLSEIRSLMSRGLYQEAADLVVAQSHQDGYEGKRWTDPFVPAFDVRIEMLGQGKTDQYARSVDFSTGEASVGWLSDGRAYTRKLFVSRADDLIVIQIKGIKKNSISCRIWLDTRPTNNAGGWWPEAVFRDGVRTAGATTNGEYLTYRTTYAHSWEGSVRGCVGVARIQLVGGKQKEHEGRIVIENANQVLVYIKAAPLMDLSSPVAESMKRELAAISSSYGKLLSRHVKLHKSLFIRSKLDLGGGEDRILSSEQLIAKSSIGNTNRALVEKEFDAARYAVISSSGELFPNLQGIWNGTWSAPWSADFTLNGNVQTAISADLCANIAECLLPFFDYLESQIGQYRVNAKRLYGCRGIHVPSRASSHGLNNHFDVTWPMTFWISGAGWASHFYYDYYLYTGDKKFLKNRALPFMEEAALFYEDFLIEGQDGKYLFSPSYSPENNPGNSPSQACINATMDIAVARELLTNCINACIELNVDSDKVEKWRQMLAKLPPYKINDDGAVKEWSTPLLKDNYEHRHVSHLYALYDGMPQEISDDPKLKEAFRRAVVKRFDFRKQENGGEMAFGLVQLGLVTASLRDASMTGEILEWLANNYWYANLVTTHNPKSLFNTDLCGGFPAVVVHSLVDSQPGWIELLPALPEQWRQGSIEGISCRGQIVIRSLRWSPKEVDLTLVSARDQVIELRHPKGIRSIHSVDGKVGIEEQRPNFRISLKARKQESFKIVLSK